MRWWPLWLILKRAMARDGASKEADALAALRAEIDRLDSELLERFNARARAAEAVAEVKRRFADPGAQDALAFYRPEREAAVLARLQAANPGPLSNDVIAGLFREVMSACLALEAPQRVAYLGPEGTFTEQAAERHFGTFADFRPAPSITEVFRAVEAGQADFGVVPVENSTEGVVNQSLDALLATPLTIVGELELPIHQHFLLHPEASLEGLTAVWSHPQSLAQCRGWLDRHWPELTRVPAASNGEAAAQVAKNPQLAALAGDPAQKRYGLRAEARCVEDAPDNCTRFFVLGRQAVAPSGDDRTSLVVTMKNEPGTLLRALEPFSAAEVNLLRVESRPARLGQWTYAFFVDLEGHREDEAVRGALGAVEALALDLRVLGSYPRPQR